MHEAQLHEENSFITLTYDTPHYNLEYEDFQLFLKRLRERVRPQRFGFFMSGEYSPINSLAHFHACLFGFDFRDKVYFKMTPAGSKIYRSALLEAVWPFGFSSVGALTFESAGYVARYCMDKLDGDEGKPNFLGIFDPDTGEIFERRKEFSKMSLRPAIGKRWIERFSSDVYPSGKVVVNGVEARAPRYYDKRYRAKGLGEYMLLCQERAKDAGLVFVETLPGRLEARCAVSKARAALSKKSI